MNGYKLSDEDEGNVRLPTVYEALAFSPLTSIIPFDPAVIPPPVALAGTVSLNLVPIARREEADLTNASLDQEARQAQHASNRLRHTTSDISRLLNSSELPQYKFKSLGPPSTNTNTGSTSEERAQRLKQHLGPFARQVFASAKVDRKPRTAMSPESSLMTIPFPVTKSEETSRQRPKTSLRDNTATPQGSSTSIGTKTPVTSSVAVPDNGVKSGLNGDRSDTVTPARTFVINNPVISREEIAQFKQFSAPADSGETRSNDRQTKIADAQCRFRNITAEIFEAEADSSDTNGRIFTVAETTDGEVPILQADVTFKLDKVVSQLARYKCLAAQPNEDLLHIQKLCTTSLAVCSSKSLHIGGDLDEQDLDAWLSKIALADQSLISAKIILRIMNGAGEDKQLLSEDVLAVMLAFVKQAMDTCVVPIVEMRATEDPEAFKVARRHKDQIIRVFGSLAKLFSLLANVLATVDLDETTIASIESLCTTSIFVENASSEPLSAIGIQIFERLRQSTMQALASLFANNENQRQSIFDTVLTSLEKLPVGRQSARHYKVTDARPIQLVSALILELIQTSAMVPKSTFSGGLDAEADAKDVSDAESGDESGSDLESGAQRQRKKKRDPSKTSSGTLESLACPAFETALRHSAYVTHFLVSRAVNSSKTSGEPYRNLLDIFIEDFINVLGHIDWPAAELVLRQFLHRLWEILEGSKSLAPAKAMSLELMGVMVAGITDLRLRMVDQFARSRENPSPLLKRLNQVHAKSASDEATDKDFLQDQGPYRAAVEFVRQGNQVETNNSAAYLYATQWAYEFCKAGDDTDVKTHSSASGLKDDLEALVQDVEQADFNRSVDIVTEEEARLAAMLIASRLPFTRHFNQIFGKLLSSMGSDQASLRTKSLRSIEDVLQKDPSVLDRGNLVLNNIVKSINDQHSSLVRDAALGLLATCLQLRPRLELDAYEHIAARTSDPAINVKKRAMKMLKDIYLKRHELVIRSTISNALILRMSDIEPSVIELARQVLEEVWMRPLQSSANSNTSDARYKLALASQASLIVETMRRSPASALVLQDLLEDLMSNKSSGASSNITVCEKLVGVLIEGVVDQTALGKEIKLADLLRTLAVFALARPRLFSSTQVKPLLPYLRSLQTQDDLEIYRHAIKVLRCTLPHITNLPTAMLDELQTTLLTHVQKLPQAELKEAVACLWALKGMTGQSDKLVSVTASAMAGLSQRCKQDITAPQLARQVIRLLSLVGQFASTFDLDEHISTFHGKIPDSKGATVVAIATNIICPLTAPKIPEEVRIAALESLLRICQAWPKQYLRADVVKAIELAFSPQDPKLESVIMHSWSEFFVSGSDRRPVEERGSQGAATGVGADRIEKTYVATDRDGASTSLAQRFMPAVIRIALNSTDELAHTSAQVLININKMGLVHPKESACALVALETSSSAQIANSAFEEHSNMFSKHESIFEKETIRSVQQAFEYQQTVVKSIIGYSGAPPRAKLQLFWDVLKKSSAKVRKRFLSSICSHLDFSRGKLDMAGEIPSHVALTYFCVQNLSLFDYTKAEDLSTLVDGLEKVFSSTGTSVLHGIEALLLPHKIDDVSAIPSEATYSLPNGNTQLRGSNGDSLDNDELTPVDSAQLRALTAEAQVLCLLWELRTHTRKVYSMSKAVAGGRGRKETSKNKDQARAPQRVTNAASITEKFLARTTEILASSGDESSQRAFCLSFQVLMTVDDEVKIRAEDDMNDDSILSQNGRNSMDGSHDTPSGDEAGITSAAGTPRKRGMKRKSMTPSATPKKKRATGGERRSQSKTPNRDDEEYL